MSVVFLFHGMVLGVWATQVPLLRDRLGIQPGALGLALLCISIGALGTMPFAHALAARAGQGAVLRWGSAAACASLVLASLAPSYAVLCGLLLLFGVGFGTVDVVMNGCAVQAEQAAARPILGAVHAMWSVGAGAGSVAGAALLGLVPAPAQASVLAGTSFAAILLASRRIAPSAPEPSGGAAPRPWRDRGLWAIGALMCVAFAVEGAVADWGGIYLHLQRGVPTRFAALGYSAFCLCMVVMRLAGDRVRGRLGDTRVLGFAFVACIGMGLALAAPWPVLAVAGFGVVGIGLANVVPALFALAGARAGGARASGAAVGVASTLGYAGVLCGPPLFGAVAQATSLPVSLSLVALLCAAIGAAALRTGAGRRG